MCREFHHHLNIQWSVIPPALINCQGSSLTPWSCPRPECSVQIRQYKDQSLLGGTSRAPNAEQSMLPGTWHSFGVHRSMFIRTHLVETSVLTSARLWSRCSSVDTQITAHSEAPAALPRCWAVQGCEIGTAMLIHRPLLTRRHIPKTSMLSTAGCHQGVVLWKTSVSHISNLHVTPMNLRSDHFFAVSHTARCYQGGVLRIRSL